MSQIFKVPGFQKSSKTDSYSRTKFVSDYESSGAKIVDKTSAFKSDIILKVRSPTMNEVGLFRDQVSLF